MAASGKVDLVKKTKVFNSSATSDGNDEAALEKKSNYFTANASHSNDFGWLTAKTEGETRNVTQASPLDWTRDRPTVKPCRRGDFCGAANLFCSGSNRFVPSGVSVSIGFDRVFVGS